MDLQRASLSRAGGQLHGRYLPNESGDYRRGFVPDELGDYGRGPMPSEPSWRHVL